MRDAVLATQVHALRVDVLYALPGIRLRLENRSVVRRHDSGVVVKDIDAAVALGRHPVHLFDALGARHVHLLEERLTAFPGGLLSLLGSDIRDADAGSFCGEEERCLASDAACSTRDDDDLAVESAHEEAELNPLARRRRGRVSASARRRLLSLSR